MGKIAEIRNIKIKRHGMSGTRLFGIYHDMKKRCYKKYNHAYKYYGGRGITICEEWLKDPSSFYKWAEDNGYSEELEIDRINNAGNYCPENCRWTTSLTNMQNTRLLRITNNSGYRGVDFYKPTKKWRSQICSNNKKYFLGYHKTQIEAAIAYNNFVVDNKTNHSLNIL